MRKLAAPLAALSLLLLAAWPAAAQTVEERARLDWVEARGRLLYDLDRAAWVGTDDMLERVPDARSIGLRGYIVERDGDALAVIFFGGPQDAPVAYYRGRVVDGRVVGREIYPADARPALTPAQRRLTAVRAMVRQFEQRPCADAPFNTALIPPESAEDPVDLYLLTPQVRAGQYQFGGHHRITVAADGSVASSRAFTRGCFTFDGDQAPDDAEALMITHLLDPIPTEIHVFASLSARLPVYVATSDRRVWAVEGQRIRLVAVESDR